MPRNITLTQSCLAVILSHPFYNWGEENRDREIFQAFQRANSLVNYWNLNLCDVWKYCQLVGNIRHNCLLIAGPEHCLELIKLAWNKKLLRPPIGFALESVGEIDLMTFKPVEQALCMPIDEVICHIIYQLTSQGKGCRFSSICNAVPDYYQQEVPAPPRKLINSTLRLLLDTGQVYHTGYGYNVMTSEKAQVANWLNHVSHKVPVSSGPADMTTTITMITMTTSTTSTSSSYKTNSNQSGGGGGGVGAGGATEATANPGNASKPHHQHHRRSSQHHHTAHHQHHHHHPSHHHHSNRKKKDPSIASHDSDRK